MTQATRPRRSEPTAAPEVQPSPDRSNGYSGRARDHLANERTFLAWVRTSIAMSALGIAIERFALTSSGGSHTVGHAFVIAAILVIGLGTFRYLQVRRQLDEARFRSAFFEPVLVALTALVLAVIALLELR